MTRPAKKAADAAPTKAPRREPTEAELKAIADARCALQALPHRVSFSVEVEEGRKVAVSGPHSDQQGWYDTVLAAMGTTSSDFAMHVLGKAIEVVNAKVGTDKLKNQVRYGATIAFIQGLAPRNELESTLGVQMFAAHELSMDSLERAMRADDMHRREAFINQATKLSRTFTAQVEAFNKLRTGGKQTHEVVYIDARHGQNVFNPTLVGGARGFGTKLGQCHAPGVLAGSAAAPGLPVWGADPARHALPVSRSSGEETLPDARWDEPGSTPGRG